MCIILCFSGFGAVVVGGATAAGTDVDGVAGWVVVVAGTVT